MNCIDRITTRVPQTDWMASRFKLFLGAIIAFVGLAVNEGITLNNCRITANKVNAFMLGCLPAGCGSVA